MEEADLLADLREFAFGRVVPGGPPRIGAEIELIPVDAATGRFFRVTGRFFPYVE